MLAIKFVPGENNIQIRHLSTMLISHRFELHYFPGKTI